MTTMKTWILPDTYPEGADADDTVWAHHTDSAHVYGYNRRLQRFYTWELNGIRSEVLVKGDQAIDEYLQHGRATRVVPEPSVFILMDEVES